MGISTSARQIAMTPGWLSKTQWSEKRRPVHKYKTIYGCTWFGDSTKFSNFNAYNDFDKFKYVKKSIIKNTSVSYECTLITFLLLQCEKNHSTQEQNNHVFHVRMGAYHDRFVQYRQFLPCQDERFIHLRIVLSQLPEIKIIPAVEIWNYLKNTIDFYERLKRSRELYTASVVLKNPKSSKFIFSFRNHISLAKRSGVSKK